MASALVWVPLICQPAAASVVVSKTFVDFTGGSTSFGYNGAGDFTLSDVSGGQPYSTAPVGITTVATDAGVTGASTSNPFAYFDEPRGSGLLFDASYSYFSMARQTTIPASASPSFIGLIDVVGGQIHYGYAEFYGTTLLSYAFETQVGVGIEAVSTIPLPSSAPLFGAAVLALGGAGYAWKRRVTTVA